MEVCWGIPYPPANHSGEVQEGKCAVGGGARIFAFVVVVLVIVWMILLEDMCET